MRKGTHDQAPVKVLLDSGTSSTIVSGRYCKKLKQKTQKKTTWATKAGTFTTSSTAKIKLSLPELDSNKIVTWDCYVDDSTEKQRYDVIIGRDLLSVLKLNLDFDTMSISCEKGPYMGCSTPMKPIDDVLKFSGVKEIMEILDVDPVHDATKRVARITKANYKKADLDDVVKQCTHLNDNEKLELLSLLNKYKFLFDGTLGTWNTNPVNLELKDGATPYHGKPYPVPKIHEKVFREEIERLCKLGVLKKVNDSEWGAPTFIQPKKNGTVRVLSDFRELNKNIKRKPFPIPKIQDMLLNLEGFTYATSLDLNMGYYHILLTPNARRLCTIVLPDGKYEYCRLPMGICNAPDIFQEKIAELFQGFEYVRAYIDDVLLISKDDWKDHLEKLEKVLQKLAEAGLKVNDNKYFFGRHECEYLGFWVTRNGVSPLAKKVEAIKNIQTPKTRKSVRRFVGLVNYYRDMWPRRAHTLAPLTKLTSEKTKFK